VGKSRPKLEPRRTGESEKTYAVDDLEERKVGIAGFFGEETAPRLADVALGPLEELRDTAFTEGLGFRQRGVLLILVVEHDIDGVVSIVSLSNGERDPSRWRRAREVEGSGKSERLSQRFRKLEKGTDKCSTPRC
jgi:hypothetical protein